MSLQGRLDQVALTGRGTHVLMWAYIVTSAVLAIWSIGEVVSPWPTVVALAVLIGVGVVLTLDNSEPLQRSTAVMTVVAWVAVALFVSWQLEVAGGHSQWYFGAGTVTMFFIGLRGRLGIAWLGFIAQSLVIVAWGYTTEFGVVTALLLVGKQLPILLVGTLFTVGLRRTTATMARLTERTSNRAIVEAAQLASTNERNARLQELDAIATPLLARLVEGTPLTDADRMEFAVAEAELRDGLRARSLTVPPVVAAARAARQRGVQVVLLDDRYPDLPDATTLAAITSELVAALDSATTGRVVARLLPPGRSDAATILSDTGTAQEHRVVPEPGAS